MLFRNRTLFNTVINKWLLFKKISIKQSTYYRYKYIISKYIIPYFNQKTLQSLENYDFNEYVNYLSKNLSKKTVLDIVTVLKSILKYIKENYNVNFNLKAISIPKRIKKEAIIFSKMEERKIEQFCLKNFVPKYIGILISLNTGLRLGEICSLKWENINLKEKLIFVEKNVQRIYKGQHNTQILIDDPKTNTSIRKIPINDKLLEILKDLKKTQNTTDTYFLTGTTKIMEPRNYYRFYKNVLEECNIPNYKFHTLRHTFATNCIKLGMDPKSLSELLGHANVDITLNIYVHSSYTMKKKFLNKL